MDKYLEVDTVIIDLLSEKTCYQKSHCTLGKGGPFLCTVLFSNLHNVQMREGGCVLKLQLCKL